MKIIFFLLFIMICALDVKLSDQCTCTQLLSKADCTAKNCTWNSSSTCEEKKADESTSTYPTSQLCDNIKTNVDQDCPITVGCGYNDQTKKCEQFSGCSAYNKQTNDDCQKASKLCTTDGKNCISPLKCEEYLDQTLCTKNISTSGTKQCKWSDTDLKCYDQVCSDAADTYITDSQCNRYLSGCVTTGRGCVSILEQCSTYAIGNCKGRVGADGNCQEKDGVCQRIPCVEAPEYWYDKQCEKFQKGCVTTGRGCVEPPLQQCSSYLVQANKCLVMIGSEGKCEGTPDLEICRPRQCDSATETTNDACDAYKSGCLTDGVKCVDKLSKCNIYTDNCDVRIGSDGNCKKGTGDNCDVRLCADASNKIQSDAECQLFQTGCVTSGAGCVSSRKNCDTYNGTIEICAQIVGSDGRCKGQDATTAKPCVLATCEDAPKDYKSHSQCQLFQSNCLSTGAGCEVQTTCLATKSQFACEGTKDCSWNKVCVTALCSKYTLVSLCELNEENGKPCYWTGSSCRLLQCSDAPTTTKTNEDCDKFLTGCRTNLAGCQDPLDPCSAYQGNEDECKSFIGNGKLCWGIGFVKQACTDRLCNMNTTSTTDQDCSTFQVGCLTKGTGCILKTEPCASYLGDQTTCAKFTGSDGKCYNDSNANCRVLVCTDNTTALTDADCDKFLTSCVYGGAGCIKSTEPCTTYTGNSTDICSKFSSNGNQCWWESGSNCVLKLCTHNTTATSDQDCTTFLKGCVTNGNGCQNYQLECNTYQGTEAACSLFKGNNNLCTFHNSCTQKFCSDVQTPTSQSDCINYMSTCRYDGTHCMNSQASCTGYSGDSTLCQSISDQSGKGCWLADGGNGSCLDRVCTNKASASNQEDCDSFMSGCVHDGVGCQSIQSTCSSYNNFTQNACKIVKTTGGDSCWKNTNDVGTCEPISCANIIDSPSIDSCAAWDDCVYTGTKCQTKSANCSSYTTFTKDACQVAKKINGDMCWATADGTCQERLCSDVIAPVDTTLTNDNCVTYLSTCRLGVNNHCVDSLATCNLYGPNYSADICRQITATNGDQCWKLDMLNVSTCDIAQVSCVLYMNASQDLCRKIKDINGKQCWKSSQGGGVCEERTCSNQIPDISITNCSNHLLSYPLAIQCTYSGSGAQCIQMTDDCQKYVGFTQGACRETKTTLGSKCWKTATGVGTCENRICDQNVVNPSFITCFNHLPTCTYNGSQCQTKKDYCADYLNLLAEQCQTIEANIDGKCWSQSAFVGSCIKRTCVHNTTASTDIVCEDFLTGCVTNTKGCVPSSNACTTYSGTVSQCNLFKGCKRDDTTPGTCQVRTCLDNQDATTDADCSKFLTGCVTQGKGCISATLPCSAYIGTRDTCKNFTGNNRRCWNTLTATERTPCIERVCTDNSSSTTDTDCDAFQYGCVTNGNGCIDKSLPCSKYQGVQATCANFKGINGTKKCWNTNSATSNAACIDRLCTHNSKANSDKDCNTFLEGCITKGTGCVYQQNCKNFLGTIKTCPNFSAKDKPCKGVSNVVASCVSVECYEAANTYDTDEKCEKFKTGCKTTGFGCVDASLLTCENIQTQEACKVNTSCVYSQNCRGLQNDCSIFKTQSICINTPVIGTVTKRCAWHYVNGNGVCENWKCSDASETITTHDECAALHETCTSKGKGCIEKQACTGYTTSIICQAAKTTDVGDYCIWDKTSCRARKCSDASKAFRTDAKCKTYLSACLTTGQGCEQPPFTCDKIVTQTRCTQDTQLKPCLWQNSKCIAYTSCADFSRTTFEDCQAYGEKCISDGVTCIAISLCERYLNETSCIYGTDGVCGWLPADGSNAAKCVLFKECAQAASTETAVCAKFSNSCSVYKTHASCTKLPTCISDGKQCFPYGKCETYLTELACNNRGNDGKCFWDATKCRLRECTDATVLNANNIVTHESCSAFDAKTKCTTNSVNCISQDKCTNYNKLSCFYGLDGACIVENEKCRLKVCADYKETTTELCEAKLTGCISDGLVCLSKLTCSSYKTKMSCHSNGTDGVCIWIEGTTTTAGVCKQMTKCEDAHIDMTACQAKAKACQYNTATKTCIAQTCSSLANGTTCNPIQSFDGKTATICIVNPQLTNSTTTNSTNTTSTSNSTTIIPCIIGDDLSKLTATQCYSFTAYTYTWSTGSSTCSKCANTTDSTNTTTPNATTNTTDEENGFILSLIWAFIVLGQ